LAPWEEALASSDKGADSEAQYRTSLRHAREDQGFRLVTQLFAVLVLALLTAIIISLAIGAAPAFQKFGLGFIFNREWNPVTEEFGGLAPIFGTLATSTIALIIAIPLSFGIALFLTELCPVSLRTPLGILVELLAAVPSIIYGMWGLFVFAPAFAEYVQPALQSVLGPIPLLGALVKGPPMGIGMLTAGIILAFMVIPFIAAVMRDVFSVVPSILKESAYGLGCTTWEVVWNVVLPYTKAGVVGGIMLGLGRALGETMAVTFVIGNAYELGPSLFSPGNSIASSLANEFAEAHTELHTSALIALGLLLFVITLAVLAVAKLLLLRVARAEGART
jgi:phosphate transport system permease protein